MKKPEVFLDLYRRGLVRVFIDGRRPGVVLPPRYLSDPTVMLEYGPNLSTPIEGLEIDGFGVRAVLTFKRERHVTFIPWASISAMCDRDGAGVAWESDDQPPMRATRGLH